MTFIDAQCLLGRFRIQEFTDVAEIVTERRFGTFLADIVRVQSGRLVRRCQGHVADDEGSLTGEIVKCAVALVALVDKSLTFGDSGLHGLVNLFIDDFDPVTVVVHHFRVPRVLLFWIGKAVSDLLWNDEI